MSSLSDKKSIETFRVRLKPGALIAHDFGTYKWPACSAPPESRSELEADDPDMVFTATEVSREGMPPKSATRYRLEAYGFGELRDPLDMLSYGNGVIYAKESDLLFERDGIWVSKDPAAQYKKAPDGD